MNPVDSTCMILDVELFKLFEYWLSWSRSSWSDDLDPWESSDVNPDDLTEFFECRFFAETASCLEQRLADLYLSTSAQHNCETENQDTSQSDAYSAAADGISRSAFESYIHGMVGNVLPR